jgi:hypothetical protein
MTEHERSQDPARSQTEEFTLIIRAEKTTDSNVQLLVSLARI